MAVSRTRVVGPVGLPDGTPAPDGAIIRFTLPAWDKDGDAIIVPGRVETVVEGGAIDVDLWRTGAGERTLTYDVTAIYHNMFADRRMEVPLGRISLLSAGPFALTDLLSMPAPVPDVPDALALARASADAARTSAAQSQAWAESPSAPDPDVPTSKSAKTLAGEAAASATAADSHRAAAVTAQDAAAASRTAAAGSATAASASATAAAGSATAADASADAAAVSQTATAADAVATAQDRTAVAGDRTIVADNLASAVAQADIASAQAVIATTQAGIATTMAGEAATSAGAAAASAAEAQDVVTSLDALQDLAESEHLQRIVSLAETAGVAGDIPYLTAPEMIAFIASSEAGRALLAQLGAANTLPYYTGTGAVARTGLSPAMRAALAVIGASGQLRLPVMTGEATAEPTVLSPAMRAALALAGVASVKRLAILTGVNTAELRGAGDFGLDLLTSGARADAIWQLKAVSYNAQGLTSAERTQALENLGGTPVGRAVLQGDAPTGRYALGSPMTPQAWNFTTVSAGASTNIYAPADGQWAFIVFQYRTSDGVMNATNFLAGVVVGGGLIRGGVVNVGHVAMVWRVV